VNRRDGWTLIDEVIIERPGVTGDIPPALAGGAARREFTSDYCRKIQSPDTALRRLKKTDQNTIITGLRMAIWKTSMMAKRMRVFDRPTECAGDIHNVPRFTKIGRMEKRKRDCDDMPKAVGIKEKDGAHFAHMYMTIEAVNTDHRFTFDGEPILPLTDRPKAFEKILKNTKTVPGHNLTMFYGDGAYAGVRYLSALKRNETNYFVRAPKNNRVKKDLKKATGLRYLVVTDFVVGEGKYAVTTDLVLIDRESLRREEFNFTLMKKEDRFFIYFTSVRPKEDANEDRFHIKLALKYSKRWGIETGYRDKNEFLGMTHSLAYNVRAFQFLLSILLYNIWMLFDRILLVDWGRSRKMLCVWLRSIQF
jgi:hypothetical protein